MAKKTNALDPETTPNHPELTLREVQIAIGIAEGKTYPEIGDALGLGYETVRSYVNRLREKTCRRRKAELAIWASQERSWLEHQQTDLTAKGQTDV